nr:MAG TPA: hypothetical protein [Caudoviricetes sp.]
MLLSSRLFICSFLVPISSNFSCISIVCTYVIIQRFSLKRRIII